MVTAAAPDVPLALLEQLAPGGRLVIPVGSGDEQQLLLIVREADGFRRHVLETVRFVPLLQGSLF
jgi:protein-L-isoaspartate(D-aspartate) O-methyltransferase